MFCPQCGASQPDELKFCKACGLNLQGIAQALKGGDQFDWNKTWVSQMLLSKEELDRRRGITPEVKRYNEIKGGVITASVGIGIMIFLYFLMQGVILSGQTNPGDAAILSRIWVCGVIPVFVGLALIFNGVFLSKRLVEADKLSQPAEGSLPSADPRTLRPADTSEFVPANFSVTEETTRHLSSSNREQ
jgi:hypothetical protein